MQGNPSRSRRSFLATGVAVVAAGTITVDSAAASQAGDEVDVYIVGASTSAGVEAAESAAQSIESITDLGTLTLVTGSFTESDATDLKSHPGVEYVELDESVPVPDPPTKDPEGPTTAGTTRWDTSMLELAEMRDEGATGEGVTIAILDSGIADHDLLPTPVERKNFTDHSHSDLDMPHGTMVAGVTSADNGDPYGVAGIAPDADILDVKIAATNGRAKHSATVRGFYWAVRAGADVINYSYGGPASSLSTHEAIKYARRNDVLPVISAGNELNRPDSVLYPAKYPEALAVSSVAEGGNFGGHSSQGPEVNICAPGGGDFAIFRGIHTTTLNDSTTLAIGTSFAAPAVAGVAALALEAGVSPENLRQNLLATAKDLGLPENQQGAGLVNPKALVRDGKPVGNQTIYLANTTQSEQGRYSNFDIEINPVIKLSRRTTLGSEMVGDKYFTVSVNGTQITSVSAYDARDDASDSPTARYTIPIPIEQIRDLDGTHDFTVTLWQEEWWDDKLTEWTISVPIGSGPSSGTTPTTSPLTPDTPVTAQSPSPSSPTPRTESPSTPFESSPSVNESTTVPSSQPSSSPSTENVGSPTPQTSITNTEGAAPAVPDTNETSGASGPGFGWLASLGGLGGGAAYLMRKQNIDRSDNK